MVEIRAQSFPTGIMIRGVAVAALALLMMPAAAQGQGPPSGWTVEDPEGDAQSSLPVPVHQDFVDITATTVRLTGAGLHFEINVSGMNNRDPVGYFPPEYWLEFVFADTLFHASIIARNFLVVAEVPVLGLYRQTPDGWLLLHEGEAQVDGASASLSAVVPWDAIVTTREETPLPGNVVYVVEVVSYWDTDAGFVHDEFPEEHDYYVVRDAAEFPPGLLLAVPGSVPGPIQAFVKNPVRFSNGEATVFHWPVRIENDGPRSEELLVAASSSNPQFMVEVPPVASIASGATDYVNVFVETPFAHRHGVTEVVKLTMTNDDVALAIALGIEYPAIPQPAGHHNVLFGHGSEHATLIGSGFRTYWLNPTPDDDRSNLERFPANDGTCLDGAESTDGHSWWLPLDPSLRIGLDARIDEPGRLDVTLSNAYLRPAGTLYAEIKLLDEVASMVSTNPESRSINVGAMVAAAELDASHGPDARALSMDLPIPSVIDMLAPQSILNLGLVVVFCEDRLPGDVTTTGTVQSIFALPLYHLENVLVHLPLNEYFDAVEVEATAASVQLRSGETRVEAPPGAAVLFEVDLEGATPGASYRARLLGPHVDYARIYGAPEFRATDGEAVAVGFHVPHEASAGDAYEVVLLVEAVDDPSQTVGIRLVVLVDLFSTRDDTARLAEFDEEHRSPEIWPGIAAIMAVAVACHCVRRTN